MKLYRGETVAAGIALGPVYLQGYEDEERFAPRIPSDQVEEELNLLRGALARSRQQIEDIRAKQQDKLKPDELRIFDTHLTYLQDPLFIDEIEKKILAERYSVRAAIVRVIRDYDRIFELVENDILQKRASDLRDVGTRVQRNLDDAERQVTRGPRPTGQYVLAAARLTTTDMFDLDNQEVAAIVAEEGGISSHAAILARSMGIPTITGIRDLPDKLEGGGLIIVDGTAGEILVDPDNAAVEKYQAMAAQFRAEHRPGPEAERAHETRDGVTVRILASCGSLGEVGVAGSYGMDGIGLFRTELHFLAQRSIPAEDDLVEEYQKIVREAGGKPIHFRLLDISSNTGAAGFLPTDERNPSMGVRGVRWMLDHTEVLRLQLRAILRAAASSSMASVLVPFVTNLSDLGRVKAAVLEERQALRKRGVACADTLGVAPIIEVPAAAFVLRSLLEQSDFAVVAIDDLQAHLLAADRDNVRVRAYYELVHPALFELLSRMAQEANERQKRLVLFGEGAGDRRRLPLFLGLGIRDFSVAPVRAEPLLKVLRRYTTDECRRIADKILQAPRALDVERILVRLGEG